MTNRSFAITGRLITTRRRAIDGDVTTSEAADWVQSAVVALPV